ncbi:MAG: hypothetical protein IJZ39_05880 [Oscillospiraceae bacterium]|nr:hypothetical protein [Oscillospiraceae bacterium]
MKITFEKSDKKGGKVSPLLLIAVAVFLGIFIFWMMGSDIEPIADTNGPEDTSLVTITDDNILNLDMGAHMPIGKSSSKLEIGNISIGSDIEFSSDNFSGVYEVMYNNFFLDSDVYIRLNYLKVNGGNFRMVVVYNDEIIHEIEPSEEPIELLLEDLNGTVSVRIAGESADYEFAMFAHDYELFAHP